LKREHLAISARGKEARSVNKESTEEEKGMHTGGGRSGKGLMVVAAGHLRKKEQRSHPTKRSGEKRGFEKAIIIL